MKFRELLSLYKKGELPEKEKPIVEEEIDKFEALSDYVYSEVKNNDFVLNREFELNDGGLKVDADGVELAESEPSKSDRVHTFKSDGANSSNSDEEDFTKSIQRQIRKAFTKMGLIVLVAAVIITLLIQFILPPVVSLFYYNPAKEIPQDADYNGDENYKMHQIDMDFRVYAELNLPMENRDNVTATPLGYGKYNLVFGTAWQSAYDKEKPAVSGELVRDELKLYLPDAFRHSYQGFAYTSDLSYGEIDENGKEITIKEEQAISEEMKTFVEDDLSAYDNNKMLKVNISFKDPIDFETMKKLEEKYEIAHAWYAVVCRDKYNPDLYIDRDLGFSLTYSGGYEGYKYSEYPNLFNDWDDNSDDLKTHFMSMLKYLSDREDFLKIFSENETDSYGSSLTDMYKSAYKYVEKNGLEIYGCYAFISKKDLLKMIENDDAYLVRFMEFGQQ